MIMILGAKQPQGLRDLLCAG
jgi:hypothetical protein